jgi:hypothetical protein
MFGVRRKQAFKRICHYLVTQVVSESTDWLLYRNQTFALFFLLVGRMGLVYLLFPCEWHLRVFLCLVFVIFCTDGMQFLSHQLQYGGSNVLSPRNVSDIVLFYSLKNIWMTQTLYAHMNKIKIKRNKGP